MSTWRQILGWQVEPEGRRVRLRLDLEEDYRTWRGVHESLILEGGELGTIVDPPTNSKAEADDDELWVIWDTELGPWPELGGAVLVNENSVDFL